MGRESRQLTSARRWRQDRATSIKAMLAVLRVANEQRLMRLHFVIADDTQFARGVDMNELGLWC